MIKWIYGNFANGAITEVSELPVVKNSDRPTIDVNATDAVTLNVSKSDLSGTWSSTLKQLDTLVALVDTSATWSTAVLWAGFITKTDASPKEVITIQAAGLREYLANVAVTSVFDASSSNPEDGLTFEATNWEGVMASVITKAFSTSGIPALAPKPPQILGTVPAFSGTTVSIKFLNSDFYTYAEALDEIKDSNSNGIEYRFVPRWENSGKARIVFDVILGTTAVPHINENLSESIVLADNSWKPLLWKESRAISQMASRIVGQSKAGEDTSGADFTTKTSTTQTSILIDQFFNPGVELDGTQMSDQLTARLSYAQSPARTAAFERAYDEGELQSVLSILGKMATFSGTGQTSDFGLEMRVVGIDFSASERKVAITLMQKAARYPKLPKGSWNPGTVPNTKPIIPRIPANQPLPGIPEFPPFELPNFEEESPLTLEGGKLVRRSGTGTNQSWTYISPKLSTMRKYGKFLYALSAKGVARVVNVMEPSSGTPTVPIISNALNVMCFDLDSNASITTGYTATEPYSATITNANATSSQTIATATLQADAFPTADDDLVITPNQFVFNPPINSSNNLRDIFVPQNGATSTIDFDLIVGEDTIMVRVLYAISNCVWTSTASSGATVPLNVPPEAKWKTKEVVYQATRNPTTGAIGTFSAIGPIFDYTEGIDKTWWSPGNTWIYDNKIYSFGGYGITKSLIVSGFAVKESLPSFITSYYEQTLMICNLDGTDKTFTKNFLPVTDLGPSSSALPWMRTSDVPRPNRLNSRVNGNQVTIGTANGLTNHREYFYGTLPGLSFSKIMNTTNGPVTTLEWGQELFRGSDVATAPEIIGDTILLVEQGGSFIRDFTAGTQGFVGRKVYTSRCKVGFADTVIGTLSLPDTGNIAIPFTWAPISSMTLSANHSTGAFFGVRANIGDKMMDSVSNYYFTKPSFRVLPTNDPPNTQVSNYFVNFVDSGDIVDNIPRRNWVTKGIRTDYDPGTSQTPGLMPDMFYFAHAGKLYLWSEQSFIYGTTQAASAQPGAVLQRYNIDSSGW